MAGLSEALKRAVETTETFKAVASDQCATTTPTTKHKAPPLISHELSKLRILFLQYISRIRTT